jgi:hypothetical protein
VISISLHLHLDVGSIRGRDIWLGHEESRANLASHQWLQPLLLLGVISVLGQDLHVTGIWGSAVASLRRGSRAAEVLSHQTILEVGEAGRLLVVALCEEQVPEPEFAGLSLEVIDNGGV